MNGDAARARGAALVVTNATKVVGLAVVVNEVILRSESRPMVLALSAFMLAGAQLSEGVLIALVDRFFGSK